MSGRKPVVGRPPRAAPVRSLKTGGKRETRLKLTVPFEAAEMTKRLSAEGVSSSGLQRDLCSVATCR